VQPTPLSKAGMVFGGACIISAWIFDDPSFFFVGSAVYLFLILSLHTSISAAKKAALSLKGTRHTKERFSRSGTRITMTNTLSCQVQPGYLLEVEEILPHSATDVIGEIKGSFSHNGACKLHYSFRVLAHGTLCPGGVSLLCSGVFFRIIVAVQKPSLQNPTLFVFPEKGSIFESTGGFGDRETMRRTPVKSTGIHSFREFRQGDNMRDIDWKMTARYGTTYVREYTGSEGGTSTLIIDLPDDVKNNSEEIFFDVRKAVLQRIAHSIDRRETSLVIILSGCEIVAYREIIPGTDILQELSDLITPRKRLCSLYRAYAPIMLSAEIRKAGKYMPLTSVARKATSEYIRSSAHHNFEETMYQILSASHDTEIHCYTTGKGDFSHIWAVATSAYAFHRPMRIFLPESSFKQTIRKEADFFHVRSFEMIQ